MHYHLVNSLSRAGTAASLCVQQQGAIPSLPTRAEVDKAYNANPDKKRNKSSWTQEKERHEPSEYDAHDWYR